MGMTPFLIVPAPRGAEAVEKIRSDFVKIRNDSQQIVKIRNDSQPILQRRIDRQPWDYVAKASPNCSLRCED